MHCELVPFADTESFQLNTGHKSAKEKCLQQIWVSFANSALFYILFSFCFIFLCVIFREFSKVFRRLFVFRFPLSAIPYFLSAFAGFFSTSLCKLF